MPIKFNRQCRVEFGGIEVDPVTDLRVQFELDRSNGRTLNHGVVSIFNLNPRSRAAIAKPMPLDSDYRPELSGKVITVKLFAGYENDMPQVFSGDMLWAHNERVGPDWITRMDLHTGLTKATLPSQVSFKEPTPARVVLEEILRPMQISLEYTDEAATLIEAHTVQSYSGSGLAYRDADDFLKNSLGLEFTIEEEAKGLVYNPRRARDPEVPSTQGNTFSPDNGLIGTPKITSDGIQIRSLLRPHFALFQRFFVQSATTQGTLQDKKYVADYGAKFIKHVGDTRGEEWFTEIDGFYSKLNREEIADE